MCRYISNPDFDPSLVKNASNACEGLCKWVRALDVYDRVIKVVAPKKLKLAEAEAQLATQMKKLNAKRKQLKDVRQAALYSLVLLLRGGSLAEWLACWTQAQSGQGTNPSRDAVG